MNLSCRIGITRQYAISLPLVSREGISRLLPNLRIDLAQAWYQGLRRRAFFRFEGVADCSMPSFLVSLGICSQTRFSDVKLTSSGTSDDIEFVMGILRNYSTAPPSTHDVMKAVAAATEPDGDQRIVELQACLFETRVFRAICWISSIYIIDVKKKGRKLHLG